MMMAYISLSCSSSVFCSASCIDIFSQLLSLRTFSCSPLLTCIQRTAVTGLTKTEKDAALQVLQKMSKKPAGIQTAVCFSAFCDTRMLMYTDEHADWRQVQHHQGSTDEVCALPRGRTFVLSHHCSGEATRRGSQRRCSQSRRRNRVCRAASTASNVWGLYARVSPPTQNDDASFYDDSSPEATSERSSLLARLEDLRLSFFLRFGSRR